MRFTHSSYWHTSVTPAVELKGSRSKNPKPVWRADQLRCFPFRLPQFLLMPRLIHPKIPTRSSWCIPQGLKLTRQRFFSKDDPNLHATAPQLTSAISTWLSLFRDSTSSTSLPYLFYFCLHFHTTPFSQSSFMIFI